MESLWVCFAPSPMETRVLAQTAPGQTLLQARLRPSPAHPRAPRALLEALTLWHGMPVRAARCVDERDGGSVLAPFAGRDLATAPLYTVRRAHHQAHPRRDGLGDFDDLDQLLRFEVGR